MIQAAWIFAMPAFRGPDEFDHLYRADGVAHGVFRPGPEVEHGVRGQLTPVRLSLIRAAGPTCESYKYTLFYNCRPYDPVTGEWNRAGSGAGRYNPTYYALAGNAGRFFEGATVDYAVRIATGVGCAVLLAWAAALWIRLNRSRWATLGMLTALTPVLLFSTAIAAPNGISYAAGVLFWVAGLVLIRGTARPDRGPLAASAVSAVLLCNTHTTGPIWLLLISITLVLLEPRRFLGLFRDGRTWIVAGVVGLGALSSVAWTLYSSANALGSPVLAEASPVVRDLVEFEVLWLLQTIAAFPLRNEPAPQVVYALWLVPFVTLMVRAIRLRGRVLLAVCWIAGTVIFVATVLTVISYQSEGYAWQGRYSLPLAVGLALIPAAYGDGPKAYKVLFDCAVAAMVVATGISVWHVAHGQRGFVQEPLTNHLAGGAIVVGLLAAIGFAILAWSVQPVAPAVGISDTSTSAPLPQPVAKALR